MKRSLLAGQEVVVDSLAQQRVPERVAVQVTVHPQQLRTHRLLQGGIQPSRVEAGHGGQVVMDYSQATNRRRCKHPPPRLGQGLDPQQQQITKRVRQLLPRLAGSELLDKERQPTRALDHVGQQVRIRWLSAQVGQHRLHVG